MVLLPAGKAAPSEIVAFQIPPAWTVPPLTVKPTGWPLMANRMFAGNRLPSLSSRPDPLSLCTVPLTSKEVPATGLAAIASTTKIVVERTVIDERFTLVAKRSTLPLNTSVTVISPSGWLVGTR